MHRSSTTRSTLALAILILAARAAAAPTGQSTYTLRPDRAAGRADLVQAVLEVGGDLKLAEEGKVDRVKMNVVAKFVYDEMALEAPARFGGPVRSVRHYHRADAEIQSGEHAYKPSLREERRLIGVEVDGPDVTLFSPHGPITLEELDLIDVLGNTLVLDRLLPHEAVAIDGQWDHSDDVLAALLGLDAVSQNEVQSTLADVADGKAECEITGRVSGQEDGVSSELELKGKYHFDLEAKRITWFAILVREDREIGHVDTGFDVVARLQAKVTPGRRSERLSGAALADVPLKPTAELTRLSYEPPEAQWRLAHDRRWSVITEEENRAVLRLIDEGVRVAQCNVASLAAVADPSKLTLEGFQEEVERALDESFGSLVRASQHHSESDYRVYRVVAEGETSSLPMQWIYYLVIDKHGRRVVLAFVLEKEKAGLLKGADEQLVEAFRFAEPKVASKPAGDAPSDGEKH